MTIFDVLAYGPIVSGNEELGLLVTVNGSYYNLWVSRGDGKWENTDCASPGAPDSNYPDLWKAVSKGEKRLEEWVKGDDANEEEEVQS